MDTIAKVKILGNDYTIKTDSSEEHVYQVANYINRKLEEISQNIKSAAPLNLMILVALNITSDYFKIKKEKENLLSTVENRVANLIKCIEDNSGGK